MLIDKYVPSFQFRERHTLEISAQASDVLRAAINYQPDNDQSFKQLLPFGNFPTNSSIASKEIHSQRNAPSV
jgi:hypothetical protein